MKPRQLLLLLLAPAFAMGGELSIPPPYKAEDTESPNCKLMSGAGVKAHVCILYSSLETAARESGMFILSEEGQWLLSGPGIPNPAKTQKIGRATLYSGVAFCPTQDAAGAHAAGGQCFFGVGSKNNLAVTYSSDAVRLEQWSTSNIRANKRALVLVVRRNLLNH